MLNHTIDNIKCLVRRSHFTKLSQDDNIFDNCYAFGIQSISGKILTFHIMTDYGMMRSRVPISEIFLKKPSSDIPFDYKQLWDCFSENVTVITYDYLSEKRCEVVLKNSKKIWASYLFTVDWYNNSYSDQPSDYKCGHVLASDDGYLLCQPNNRIFWKDCNWVTKKFPIDPKLVKVDQQLLSVEALSDRWVSEDNNCFYYDINKI